MKFFLIAILVGFSSVGIAQNDSISKGYFGLYSSPINDAESGDEMVFYFGNDSNNNLTIYKEAFVAGNNYATYFKLISFDKQTGKTILKSEKVVISEEGTISIENDDTQLLELFFLKKSNGTVIQGDFHEADFVKSAATSFSILGADGQRKMVQLYF
jgi:hypothetical protein